MELYKSRCQSQALLPGEAPLATMKARESEARLVLERVLLNRGRKAYGAGTETVISRIIVAIFARLAGMF